MLKLEIIVLSGVGYGIKSTGPSTEPVELHMRVCQSDTTFLMIFEMKLKKDTGL